MPSRRSVLGGLGLVGLGTLAGCTDLSDLSDLASGPPAYADWLYDPAALFDTDRVLYATLDVERLSATRDALPSGVDETIGRLDRQVTSVSLETLTRLVGIGYGSLEAGRVGGTVVAEGRIDPDAVRAEFEVRTGDDWLDEGGYRGHDLWAYEPSFLQEFSRYRGPDQSRAPDVTLGLGIAAERLVVGGVLDTDRRGVEAVRAALDAETGATTPYVYTSRAARDVTDTLERTPFSVGVSTGLVELLAARVPEDRPTVRTVLEDLSAVGLGVTPGEPTTTTLALVYDPGEVASVDTVRSLVEEVVDGDDAGDDGRSVKVGLAQSGRVVVVTATVDPAELLAGLEGVDLSETLL